MGLLDGLNSWTVWDAGGQQTGTPNILIDGYTLNYCDPDTSISHSVNCNLYVYQVQTYVQDVNGVDYRFWNQKIRGVLDSPIIGSASTAQILFKFGFRCSEFLPPDSPHLNLDFLSDTNEGESSGLFFDFTSITEDANLWSRLQREPQGFEDDGASYPFECDP